MLALLAHPAGGADALAGARVAAAAVDTWPVTLLGLGGDRARHHGRRRRGLGSPGRQQQGREQQQQQQAREAQPGPRPRPPRPRGDPVAEPPAVPARGRCRRCRPPPQPRLSRRRRRHHLPGAETAPREHIHTAQPAPRCLARGAGLCGRWLRRPIPRAEPEPRGRRGGAGRREHACVSGRPAAGPRDSFLARVLP